MITVTSASSPDERATYRDTLKNTSSYESTYNRLESNYNQVQSDIQSTRGKLSLQAGGNYLKNAAAAAVLTGGIKYGIDMFNTQDHVDTVQTLTESPTQRLSEEARFKLSGHDIKAGDPNLHTE